MTLKFVGYIVIVLTVLGLLWVIPSAWQEYQSFAEHKEVRHRIAGTVARSELVRLNSGGRYNVRTFGVVLTIQPEKGSGLQRIIAERMPSEIDAQQRLSLYRSQRLSIEYGDDSEYLHREDYERWGVWRLPRAYRITGQKVDGTPVLFLKRDMAKEKLRGFVFIAGMLVLIIVCIGYLFRLRLKIKTQPLS